MGDMVKYKNYMNKLSFAGFTSVDFNFLMTLCSKALEQGTKEITLSFDEIKRISGYDGKVGHDRFISELHRMNRKLMNVVCEIETPMVMIMFVLFPTFVTDKKANTLTVAVNEKFRFVLNEITKEFTQFELGEFVSLRSVYSKCLYRLLKQFRSTGEYFVLIDDFRALMDVPKSYSNKYVTERVLNPSVAEIGRYFQGLKYEIIYEHKRGQPVKGYKFMFRPEKLKRIAREKGGFQNFEKVDVDYDSIAREKVLERLHGRTEPECQASRN